MTKPKPGDDVWYENDRRGGFGYFVPAIVSVTRHNLVPEAVEQGLLSGLDSDTHVHLTVFGPGSVYHEENVPYDPDKSARSWRWPGTGLAGFDA